jgi:amidase
MSDNPEYLYWSACEIAAQIRSGALSSVEVTQACLDRIEQVNPSINAVVQLCAARALAEALHYDELTVRKEFAGPLHGVPITLKDSIDTEAVISTGGTMGRKNHVPTMDATVAARLRNAGAVLMGKTNTPELTLSGETNNLIYGRTKNPFDLDRSPGGSSGGSAAIVASGGCALELGSDTGGSIREPAHLCGIAGIKPTSGRAPRTGHIVPFGGGVLDSLTQIGPMARYVEDLTLSLPIICGPDGIDPYVVPVALGNPDEVNCQSLKIAWYNDNGVTRPCDDIMRVTAEVAERLDREGFMIEEIEFPDMQKLVDLSTQLRESANAGLIVRLLEKYGTVEPGPDLDGYLTDEGLASVHSFDPEIMEKIDSARSRALQFMSKYDAVLCPASHAIARPHFSSRNDTFNDWSYITVHNLLGWPGGTVRAGTSEQGGLPVGVQIVAAPWREDIVLALLAQIETLFGGYQRPPL